MAKRNVALNEYISASDAAQILSAKHGRSISVDYVRLLSKRKKNPIRTQQMGDRLLYLRADIEAANIRKKERAYS